MTSPLFNRKSRPTSQWLIESWSCCWKTFSPLMLRMEMMTITGSAKHTTSMLRLNCNGSGKLRFICRNRTLSVDICYWDFSVMKTKATQHVGPFFYLFAEMHLNVPLGLDSDEFVTQSVPWNVRHWSSEHWCTGVGCAGTNDEKK